MIINDKVVFVYDIEVFPNLFTVSIINSESNNKKGYEISERRNDLSDIINIFCNKKIVFCGYNNLHYDDIIINYIIIHRFRLNVSPYSDTCRELKELSDTIINSKDFKEVSQYKYAHIFKSLDLLSMLFSNKLRVGLKELQITMNFKKVQEYEGNFNVPVKLKEIDNVINYNFNDIESTLELLNRCKEEINLRVKIEKKFNISALNKDCVNLGMEILKKKYLEKSNLSWEDIKDLRDPCNEIAFKDIIFDFIKFKTPELKNLLNTLKDKKINLSKKEDLNFRLSFFVGNLEHTLSLGGLHSCSLPESFEISKDQSMIDSDCVSMYPSIVTEYKLYPPQLGESFLEAYIQIKNDRIKAKHNGDILTDKTYKLAINGFSGNLQSPYSWCYSPNTALKLRLNGQLMLLMLAESIVINGGRLIQSNTDGILYIINNRDKDKIMNICSEWEKLTKLKLEHEYFERFYQYSINDYIGIKKGYSETKDASLIKVKGAFLDTINLGRGMSPLIVAKACINYFVNNISVDDTIKSCKDIKMFLTYQKIDRKFKVEYKDKYINRINRYYMSTNGYYMYKNELDYKGDIIKQTSICTSSGITILNELDESRPIEDYHINYLYYRNEAYKLITPIDEKQLLLF